MIDMGLPYHPDMFSTGETPHGCGDVPRTVHQGIRSTAADFVTKGQKKANITIKTEVVVDKVLFSNGSGEPTATGVSTISKEGKKIDYQARKEVIVTAGAYCSPTILMRSGLGPKAELEKHGIECRVDLPGVGQNLQDHCVSVDLFPASHSQNTLALTNLYSSKARLHLLRSLRTKPHKRLPRLPRQRHRLNLPTLQREKNRHPEHLPLRYHSPSPPSPPHHNPLTPPRHLRLRAPGLAPARLAPLDQRRALPRPGPNGPIPVATQHGILEHGALRRTQAIRLVPDKRGAHVRHVQSPLQPAQPRVRHAGILEPQRQPGRRPQLPRRPAGHAGHERGVRVCERDGDAGERDEGGREGQLAEGFESSYVQDEGGVGAACEGACYDLYVSSTKVSFAEWERSANGCVQVTTPALPVRWGRMIIPMRFWTRGCAFAV